MKKKLLGGLFILLALSSLSAISQTQGSAVVGCLVLALIFGFLGLKQFGVIKSSKAGKVSGNDTVVLTIAGSDKYHRTSNCQYIKGKQTLGLYRSSAKEKGYHPCKSCYPRGD